MVGITEPTAARIRRRARRLARAVGRWGIRRWVAVGGLAILLSVACGGRGLHWPALPAGPAEPSADGGDRPAWPLRCVWVARLGAAPVGPALVSGNVVVQLTTAPAVVALDGGDGRRLGRQPLLAPAGAGLAVVGGLVVVPLLGRSPCLQAYEMGRGRRRWQMSAVVHAAPGVAGDTLLVAGEHGDLQALEAGSGRQLWRAPSGRRPAVGPGVGPETAWVVAGGQSLAAVDLATGRRRWQADLGARPRTVPVLVAGQVLVGTGDARLLALDPQTGARRWQVPLPGVPAPGLAAGPDLVVLACSDGSLVALDPASGQRRWARLRPGTLRAAPVRVGGAVFAAGAAQQLEALDVASGEVRWAAPLDGPVTAALTWTGAVLLAATDKGTLYAYGAP